MTKKTTRYYSATTANNESVQNGDDSAVKILGTESEARFNNYTRLIADIFTVPMALITLFDHDRQWFKSAYGWSRREINRDISLCTYVLLHFDDVFIIPDTLADSRFADNPLVTGDPGVRFYAGTIIRDPDGRAIGTLCILDRIPRELNGQQRTWLRQFADLVESELHHSYHLNQLRNSLELSAFYDQLTGLPNRRLLLDRLQNLIELSEAEKRKIMVILCNIKGLRLINQSYGSGVGDQLLKRLADRLRELCPPGGTAARLHDGECVLVLPEKEGGKKQLDELVKKIRVSVDRPFTVEEREYYLDIQIGGSMFPEHGITAARLIDRAAAAIRVPGHKARNAIRFMNQAESLDLFRRVEIESRLRRATEKFDFSLCYQPIIALRNGEIVSFEALLRWSDEELGEVQPSDFIPVAEQSGLLIPIGQWVISRACRQLGHWHIVGGRELPIGVNVAADQLLDANFASMVIDDIEAEGITTKSLRLEITEFSMVSDSRNVLENMQALSRAGVQMYIDDFGTGYSSLEYLGRMPIAGLKIDRSFVKGLPQDAHNKAMIRTILSMAKNLNLVTVAEGVETVEQLEFLQSTGCDYVQGYLLSRPVTSAVINELPRKFFEPV